MELVELGTVYTENPLLGGQSVVANSHVDAGDSDTLLSSLQATVQEQGRRAEQYEIVVNQRIEALEALSRVSHPLDEGQNRNSSSAFI